jgi:2-C-methyl-D-erythritol 4-phosphate cytidylyltransferase
MFRYGLLRDAMQSMLDNKKIPTDEASAIEYAGAKAVVVEGRQDNIKVTRREDLVIAEAIMKNQEAE